MKVIGIDPGLYGALCLYDPSSGTLEIEDVPTLNMGKGKARKMVVDVYGLARVVDAWMLPAGPLPVVWIEQVGVRPGEGAVGAFSFGRTVGLICGICAAHFPHHRAGHAGALEARPGRRRRQGSIPRPGDDAVPTVRRPVRAQEG
jgi:hypothetical protein